MIKKFSDLQSTDLKRQLIKMGAEFIGDKVVLYRGGNVSKEILKKLRYNDFLSTVNEGEDAVGNAGASSYGKNVVKFLLPIKDLKYSNGEIQYIGKSESIEKGQKYPLAIYKAFNDYYGSNYTSQQINEMEYSEVRSIASMGLSEGRDEFDALMKNKRV